jgi:hypothetical protein
MSTEHPDNTDPTENAEMPQIDIDLDKVLRKIGEEDTADKTQSEIRVLNDPNLGARVYEQIGEKLEEAVRTKNRLTIRIPIYVIGITPGFLERMFSTSLAKINSSDEFRRVFHISASIEVSVQVVRAIEALLLERSQAT